MNRMHFVIALCFMLVAIAPSPVLSNTPGLSDGQPQFAERLHRAGLHMLGRVHSGLYRGSNPEGEDGFASLHDLGIKTVIALRPGDDDAHLLDRFGMKGVTMPMSPARPPTARQQREFLALVTDTRLQPIYVHCALGHDRTGVMIALYRVRIQGWSKNDAIAEMRRFGHSYRDYPALEKFIRSMPDADSRPPITGASR